MATAEELRRAREETAFGGLASGLFEYMRERDQTLQDQGRRPVLGGLLSKEPVMGTDTLRYEGVMPLIAGLLEPIVRGVDAPRAASQNLIPQEDMVGEAFGAAGAAMLGGGFAPKPAGSLGANSVRTKAEELRRQANIQRFGYDPNEVQEVDTSYRGSHQPVGPQDENPIRLDDLTKSITGETAGYPEDFYSSQGMRLYAQPPSFPGDEYGLANQQSYRAIQAVRGNPDAEVTIYRGVPDSDDITTINPGDFVTLSPKYAELHAASGYGPRGDEAGKVISQKVKVKDVYFAGDDVNEFGYFPTDVTANASKSAGGLAQTMFTDDVYHYMNTNKMEGDVFDSSKSFSRLDRLGPHVGTAKAAEDRYHAFYARSPELVKDYLNLTQSSTGMTMPLKARVDRPFLNEQGQPFQESELLDVMNKYADDNNIKDLDVAAAQFRKDLTDAGFTNVPYVNAIEDRGSISHIMLTGRTAGDPEVLRSRFARFQDPYDESIMAANASPISGLLAQSGVSSEQAQMIEDYLYKTGLLQ